MKAIEYLELIKLYSNTDKLIIIANIKKYITINNIKYSNKWLCNITGIGIDMVRRYMTIAKMHESQKFQLDQLCKISIALNIPLENLFGLEEYTT